MNAKLSQNELNEAHANSGSKILVGIYQIEQYVTFRSAEIFAN